MTNYVKSKKDIIIEEKLRFHKKSIEQSFLMNKNKNRRGVIMIRKLRNLKKPPLILGFANIYPNYNYIHNHNNINDPNDEFYYPSLSPKMIGPIYHNMPNLPRAINLENFWQFSKVWNFELDISTKMKELQPYYLKKRIEGYLTEKCIGSKYTRKELKELNVSYEPECAIYYNKYGQPIKYNYIQSRYFYCYYYQKMVIQNKDFNCLKEKLQNGYNFIIYGSNDYNPNIDYYKIYIDHSKPFKHEIILYILLNESDPEKYPCNIYYKNHRNIYQDVI